MSRPSPAGWRAVCLASAALLLILSVAVLAVGTLPGEAVLRETIVAWASPALLDPVRWVDHFGTWPVLFPAGLLVLGLSRHARRRWWLWFGIVFGAGLIEEGGKLLVGRPRPMSAAFGFPSGHATAAAAFAIMLIYLIPTVSTRHRSRLAVHIVAVGLMVSVGLGRIILGAHWPADVLAGFALGAACAAAGAWWDAMHPRAELSEPRPRRPPRRHPAASRSVRDPVVAPRRPGRGAGLARRDRPARPE